jgi:hypothetical protein
MAYVTAHKDERIRIRRCTCKTADVPNCMARRVEHIKGPIAEEVVGTEVTDLDCARLGEGDLAQFSSPTRVESAVMPPGRKSPCFSPT